MTDRVLVTGATGLIGRQLVPTLRNAGLDIVEIDRNRADLLDKQQTTKAILEAGADSLIHLAWHAGPADRWTSLANLDWMTASLDLLRAFADAGGKRAVMLGSCAEYDWAVPVLHEDTRLAPTSLYGSAKAATGLAATGAASALGIRLCWARLFFCYGPGEPEGRLLGDLIKGLARGDTVDCTEGLQRRDFLHTADVATALLMVLQSNLEGAVNIGSGIGTPVADLISEVARLMDAEDRVVLGARPRAKSDPDRLVADISRLATTGFQPRFGVTDGVADTLRAEGVIT